MAWKPIVRQAPIIAAARPLPEPEQQRMEEMEKAAASVAAMVMAKRVAIDTLGSGGRVTGIASSWVIQGRIEMNRGWFV